MTRRTPVGGAAIVAKNINLVFLAAVPVSAFFNWLLFWRSRYNYAENLTLHAFLGGFRVVFFLLIFTPLVLLFRQHYYAMLSIYLGLWALFVVWAHYQFYGGRLWLVALKTLFSLLLTQSVITILIMVFLRLMYK